MSRRLNPPDRQSETHAKCKKDVQLGDVRLGGQHAQGVTPCHKGSIGDISHFGLPKRTLPCDNGRLRCSRVGAGGSRVRRAQAAVSRSSPRVIRWHGPSASDRGKVGCDAAWHDKALPGCSTHRQQAACHGRGGDRSPSPNGVQRRAVGHRHPTASADSGIGHRHPTASNGTAAIGHRHQERVKRRGGDRSRLPIGV
jgi:hypothetical protein